mmetsp:Transcript_28041/g.42420  ORF Transcript_28041/g.42420 Transcript_28041/m.42420 type:complete len:526 (+) Transcript_28041:70-1647(+)|eukprot:CAMPEP_0178912810 /NCGR_PEP_ID=MMETSP0786-20121207/10479_1 /TAXON_ID=186022 /ORGANISM="Thalassionema frauenfeldii, Strain CCMP 1798" /LENGTH=525 /DNA_ID=CAMNT_0020585453 /DNA_START=55 /DNA_END=1632 /DNA_ORIENTATION=-
MSSSNIAADENPYELHTLEDVLDEVATKFQEVIKNGYPEKEIPVLDPLYLDNSVSFPLQNDKVDITFTLNDASLSGLGSISLSSTPTVDFKETTIGLSFTIKELQVSSEDYDREGTIKPLFLKYDASKFDRALTITLTDIGLNLSLDLDFGDIENPKLMIKEESSIEMRKFKTILEDSFVFNLISPLLKGVIAKALNGLMKKYLEPILSETFQSACQKQMNTVKVLEKIYKERQRQGLLLDKDGNPMKPQVLNGLEGVGQLPLPMFWKVTSVPVDKLDSLDWDEIVKTAKTGDLILCSGIAPGSLTIRRFTQSPYSHVIMFVKEDKILDGKTVVVQASGSTQFDLIANKLQGGCTVADPHAWFEWYNGKHISKGAVVTFRRLKADGNRSEEEHGKWVDTLEKFIQDTNGIAYAEGAGMEPLYIMGLVQIDLDKQEGTTEGRTYYCASYVAQLLMEFGIIERKFMSHQYSPRDFSQKYDTLPFIGSFDYGPECLVVAKKESSNVGGFNPIKEPSSNVGGYIDSKQW